MTLNSLGMKDGERASMGDLTLSPEKHLFFSRLSAKRPQNMRLFERLAGCEYLQGT